MAERAGWLARRALRYGIPVPMVRAMTPREVAAMDELLGERAQAAQERDMMDEARSKLPPRRSR